MGQDYLIELLERAFLLQQKRVWTLEMLRKIDHGAAYASADASQRRRAVGLLESNLRVARERLDHVASEIGYESNLHKLMDPSFVIGTSIEPLSLSAEGQIEQADMAEREAGIRHLKAMCRELSVIHEPYFEDVQARVRKDYEFYEMVGGLDMLEPSAGETDEGPGGGPS